MPVMLSLIWIICVIEICQGTQRPLVIGHRGTAYLPELTPASQSMAHAYGADVIEIDVCLSRDNQLIVIHDINLDSVTNVRDVFPNRHRTDGFNYVIDFDLNELRLLKVHERVNPVSGIQVYPSRFPAASIADFRLSTLNETIELLLGLNRATSRQRQLLIEIKKPEYHANYNQSISSIVHSTLNSYNLTELTDPVIVQTFYIEELTYIRQVLGSRLRLFALMTWNHHHESSSDYDFYRSEEGLKTLSEIVQGVAPNVELVVNYGSNGMILNTTNLTKWAHQYNLNVYPFTFRKDTVSGMTFPQLIEYFWRTVQVDGFITDHPDVVLELLEKQSEIPSRSMVVSQTFHQIFTFLFVLLTISNHFSL